MIKTKKEKLQLKDPLSDPFFLKKSAGKTTSQQSGEMASQQTSESKKEKKIEDVIDGEIESSNGSIKKLSLEELYLLKHGHKLNSEIKENVKIDRKPLKYEKPGIVKVTGRLYIKTKRKLEDIKLSINRKTADEVTQDKLIAEAIEDLYKKYKEKGLL